MQGLNDRQEQFCQLVVGGMPASPAYQKVYGAKPREAESNGSRLMRNDKVLTRIGQLRAEMAKKHHVTRDSLTAMLFEDAALARTLAQPGAAVAARGLVAKLHGLLIDRALHEHIVRVPSAEPSGPDELTEEQWGSRYGITYESTDYLDVTPEPQTILDNTVDLDVTSKPESEPQTILNNTTTQPTGAQTILEGSEPYKVNIPTEKDE